MSDKQWWKHLIIGLGTALFFAVFYMAGFFDLLEFRVYDFYLRFQPPREHTGQVVFLDVDDNAIAYNGVFPWPRSIMADGLLRLKEYDAAAAIFDIEYIDKGPQGIDSVYLDQGLPSDFKNSFNEISSNVSDLVNSINSGFLSPMDIARYNGELQNFIHSEQEDLLKKANTVARDNDIYLAEASAIFGHTWATLNLRDEPLTGEQAERRTYTENNFSYPLEAVAQAHTGNYVDVLPPIPSFAQSAQGAGFTNVDIDPDGVRRRIFLAQKIKDHWYLQLAFAPLIESLGNPAIHLAPRSITIKDVDISGQGVKDIVIPLDTEGRMMLNWPPTEYQNTFDHISFASFSHLEALQPNIEFYITELISSDISLFTQYSEELRSIPGTLYQILELFSRSQDARTSALAKILAKDQRSTGEKDFTEYLEMRESARNLIRDMIAVNAEKQITSIGDTIANEYPDSREAILSEAAFISGNLENLKIVFTQYEELSAEIRDKVKGKFCILGRVDTGTTDIGVNPFFGRYVNVGTHGVVLDTILSESFITPLSHYWGVILCILIPILIFIMRNFKPEIRTGIGMAWAVVIAAVSFGIFYFTGYFLGVLGPVLAMVVAVIIRELVSYMGSEQEKQFIRKALSTYTSPAVAEQIAQHPELLKLGGDRRNMSALFTDIRSFSTISEALQEPGTGEPDPVRLVNLLNVYLTRMSDIVLENQGIIDKYEGDAIIAFWGAPLPMEDHALAACRSAITMKKAEIAFNREAQEQGLIDAEVLDALVKKDILKATNDPNAVATRFGINTGNMVVGNMGTDSKMNYTIMGNAVNLAARLEGVNKQYGTRILASGDTIQQAGNSILSRCIDCVRVVGIQRPVLIYEPLDLVATATEETLKLAELFNAAMEIFRIRDWPAAEAAFEAVLNRYPEDGPAKIYLDRCQTYRMYPPTPEWDGIYSLDQK
ncbi:MAG: adenylate/guanylate cyclase domain-containing protein [Treponema sp.]|jgi:adenylate cyclase|nr:adenylate/guanylate cyclase domain-containing protein [Treponema sp.]